MKWILFILMVTLNSISFSQTANNLNHYLKTGSLMAIGRVVDVIPNIIQDDLGTAYGSISVKCYYSIDLKTISKISCPIDTFQSFIYLSTKMNKPFIDFKKQEYCLLFLDSLQLIENQSIPIFKLTHEEALFRLTPEIIQQINLFHPLINQLNLYDFIH